MVEIINERTGTWQLRRWCPYGEFHIDLDHDWCPSSECGPEGTWASRHLRKRWMLICSISDCRQGYFSEEEFNEHECYSAY